MVHGGIRHLEIFGVAHFKILVVHGGIRHLEKDQNIIGVMNDVHGGIRHLETVADQVPESILVHGGIRHLEIFRVRQNNKVICSWRHTPFRNVTVLIGICSVCSWRNLF